MNKEIRYSHWALLDISEDLRENVACISDALGSESDHIPLISSQTLRMLLSYHIIRLCVYKEEMDTFLKVWTEHYGGGYQCDQVTKLNEAFSKYHFKDARDWALAHNRKRVKIENKTKYVVPKYADFDTLNLPTELATFKEINETIRRVTYNTTQAIAAHLSDREEMKKFNEEIDREIDLHIKKLENEMIDNK